MPPRLSFTAGVFALVAAVALAQRTQTPPGAPVLDPVALTGGRQGTATELTLTGAGLADPLGAWVGAAGRVTTLPGAITGKDSTKFLRLRVDLSTDAPLGMHRLRLATAGGLSNFRPFCVDALPEVRETDTNHSPATAQPVTVPSVITGRADAETSDFFRFSATAGQRISFEVIGRRLGSRFDPVLRLRDIGGRELPRAYSDDAPGLQTDARLTYIVPAAGDYLVEVRDTTYKGGKDFWYRLRIGDFPCAVCPLPAAAKRGTRVEVNFAGSQTEGVTPVEVQAPADQAIEAINVSPVGSSGLPGWPVTLLLSDHDELTAGMEIGTLAQAQKLTLPCGVTGRFLRKSQKDHFAIAATKGQRFLIAAQTAELNSPAEVYVTVRDGAGTELAHTDAQQDPQIDFTAPADGTFYVVAEHLNYGFGPCEVYRLTVGPPARSFELSLATDRVAVPQGQIALIPVATLVRHDYGGPIELSVVGSPGLSGTVTVPPGVQAVPPPTDQPSPPPVIFLPIHAAGEVAPGAYEIKVMAKATADGKELVAFASTKAAVQAQMAGLPYPPRPWLRGVGVAVTPKPPFTLTAKWDRPEAVRGLTNRLVVTATRDAGFDGDITLSAAGLPPGVTATPKPIPGNQTEATIDVKLADNVGLGSFAFSIVGRAMQESREFNSTLLPSPLLVTLPFALRVEPNPVPLEAGGKADLNITAVRKGGFAGPIGLEPRNLPAQVTADKATIAAGQTTTTLTLTAAAAAPLGSRGDVDILGTAQPGNQQASSPPFTVRVQPPPPVLTVKAEPAAVVIKPNAKTKLKVTIERKNFAGPVVLSIDGLPAKVTAAAVTIPQEQSVGEIELTAAADAEPAKAEATLTAKATATATMKISVQVEK
jgi:hypothetical protein